MRRVVLGMIFILVLGVAGVASLKLLESHHLANLIGYSADNVSWAVHQLQVERMRLEIALLNARDGDQASLDEAALRYETFASRENVLLTGVFHRKLSELPAYGQFLAAVDRFLAANDPMMADGLQPADVAPLLAAVQAMRQPVLKLVLAENHLLKEIEAGSKMHVTAVRSISLATVITLGIFMLCFAAYALVILRRAQDFELALSRSEAALRDALREAQSASAAKSAFLANMSHELRTPLNAVIGFSEFLEFSAAHRLDERQRGYLRDIRVSGQHLLEILSSILELSKLEAGKVELQLDAVAPDMVIADCLRMLAFKAAQKRIAITAVGLDGLPRIQGDPTRLRQIFLNLLTNAVKYSGEGKSVRVTGAVDGDFVVMRIEDHGIGMNNAEIETALRPFERIRNAATANQEGVGLGLTIVKTLVEIHNGTLAIDSAVGRGTTITVRLPAGARPAGSAAEPAPAASAEIRLRKVAGVR